MDYSKPASMPAPIVEAPLSLPKLYGEDTMVLMTRDPGSLFAYWEVTENTAAPVRRNIAGEAKIVLRLYNVTGGKDPDHAHSHADYQVETLVGSWYILLDAAQKSFAAELGYIGPDGKFYPLVRSKHVSLPSADVSQKVDADWMVVEEEFARIYKLSGGGKQGPSSQDLAPLTEELRRLIARRMQADAASGGIAGMGSGGHGAPRLP